MKAFKLYLGLGALISFYLLLPAPELPPPDLPESVKSDLPGDTVQLTNVSAYFSNKNRHEVLSFYTDYFSRSKFLHIPLLTYRLNHPPEKARQVFRETKRSWYLEEIVHPLRGSLFVNGFEEGKRIDGKVIVEKKKLVYQGREWKNKISLRWFYSPGWARLLVFWFSWGLVYLVGQFWWQEIKAK